MADKDEDAYESEKGAPQWVKDMVEQLNSGVISTDTAGVKIARKILASPEVDKMLAVASMMLLSDRDTMSLGIPIYILHQHIVRLEDDVRVLRGELARERAAKCDEGRLGSGGGSESGDESEGGSESGINNGGAP